MVFIRWAETATPMINIHVSPNKNDTTTNTSRVPETQQRANMKKVLGERYRTTSFFWPWKGYPQHISLPSPAREPPRLTWRPGQFLDIQLVRPRAKDTDALDPIIDLDLLLPPIIPDFKNLLPLLLGNLRRRLLLHHILVTFSLADVEELLSAAAWAPFQYLCRTVLKLPPALSTFMRHISPAILIHLDDETQALMRSLSFLSVLS